METKILITGQKGKMGFSDFGLYALVHKEFLKTESGKSFVSSSASNVIHYCRLQAVYSPITVKNFVTVYTAFNPCNRGSLLLRLQEIV